MFEVRLTVLSVRPSGKVSAVLGALDGMMPMVNSALYTAVYHASVSTFPAAHFFLGASASALMIVFFW